MKKHKHGNKSTKAIVGTVILFAGRVCVANFRALVLFLILQVSFSMDSYPQESFTKELKWITHDSITTIFLNDTNQIIEWGEDIEAQNTNYKSKHLCINGSNIFVLMVDVCSGIYCPFIYVFKEEDKRWHLLMSSHANLTEQIEIGVNTKQRDIIFRTKSGQIGKLSFEMLGLNN